MDSSRKLLLAFDHCHILKKLRNQLLVSNRVLVNGKECYSPKYPRMLVDILKKQAAFQLVRNLTKNMHLQRLLKR